jgi:hypothetical protein
MASAEDADAILLRIKTLGFANKRCLIRDVEAYMSASATPAAQVKSEATARTEVIVWRDILRGWAFRFRRPQPALSPMSSN